MATTFLSEGTRREVAREQIQLAAARLIPAHSETFSKNQAWFALVGGGLHYVVDSTRRPGTGRPTWRRRAWPWIRWASQCCAWRTAVSSPTGTPPTVSRRHPLRPRPTQHQSWS
ncbi:MULTISPECIES: hypothetical protein [unclassified Streptomyces]|uniref:hypothetical protein n=1 Tax=unclassified Streptomyces TaxID=2593676 RepID=UPI001BE64D19|nr:MULTISPECIES: hypothetical protein [unclassified Streptomyces]MBT2404020.1 hypothetical protein [Streptomyces sp. ISL-21]MBT2607935.1 hypothetical protein [Streptomyces sp. ISL-87]